MPWSGPVPQLMPGADQYVQPLSGPIYNAAGQQILVATAARPWVTNNFLCVLLGCTFGLPLGCLLVLIAILIFAIGVLVYIIKILSDMNVDDCFAEGSLIMLSDGRECPIEDIRVGD